MAFIPRPLSVAGRFYRAAAPPISSLPLSHVHTSLSTNLCCYWFHLVRFFAATGFLRSEPTAPTQRATTHTRSPATTARGLLAPGLLYAWPGGRKEGGSVSARFLWCVSYSNVCRLECARGAPFRSSACPPTTSHAHYQHTHQPKIRGMIVLSSSSSSGAIELPPTNNS